MIHTNIFKKYKNNYWVETGSYLGDGISMAIEAEFDNIISIELSDFYYKKCKDKFKGNNNVVLYYGDSEDLLSNVISNINESITFWLDGHYSECGTAFGKRETPLYEELDIIKKHKINTHTILIDDLRCWDKSKHGFNTDDLILKLKEINPNYIIKFENGYIENDILVAYIK